MYEHKLLIGVIFLLLISPCFATGYTGAWSWASYNTTSNIYSGSHPDNSFKVGFCYDLDRILPLLNSGDTSFTSVNLEIACTDSDADFKCVNYDGGVSAVATPSRMSALGSWVLANTDCTKRAWTQTDNAINAKRCGLTTNGTYYIEGNSGDPYFLYCTSAYLHIKNETFNPYFLSNFSTGSYETVTLDLTMNPLASPAIDKVYFYITDLGYSTSLLSTAEWVYYYDNPLNGQTSQLGVNLGTHAYYNYESNTDNTLMNAPCTGLNSWQGNNFNGINVPDGTYDIYCHNNTGRNYGQYVFADIKFTNVTYYNFDAFFSRNSLSLVSISSVAYSPANPAPNASVTVTWLTSNYANTTLVWRTKPAGNWSSGFSPWTAQAVDDFVISHSSIITGGNIIENYQYQFYVASGSSINNNTNVYYNFTVGYTPLSNISNANTTNILYPAVNSLAAATGKSPMTILYIFGIALVILVSIFTQLKGNSIQLTSAVFITVVSLLSVFGWLPYYFIIMLALVVAFGAVTFISKRYS